MNPPQPRLNFFYDKKNDLLWIIHRKVASSSIRKALKIDKMLLPEEAEQYNQSRTIMPVRHPWERITAAIDRLYKKDVSFEQRIQEEILNREGPHAVDWHLWPQSYGAQGFRVDDIIEFHHLPDTWETLRGEYDLPPLPHYNKGRNRVWRFQGGKAFDWSPLLPWYEKDFEYYPDWRNL